MDKPQKSPDAYRTISEVSDQLDVPQHVLRFWETKFPQVAPMKRAGNRRYYDPAHIDLLARIRDLLYIEGYTTKGVQKLLEEGRLLEGVEPKAAAPKGPTANLMDLTATAQQTASSGTSGSGTASSGSPSSGTPPPPPNEFTPTTPVHMGTVGQETLSAIAKRLQATRDRLTAALDQ